MTLAAARAQLDQFVGLQLSGVAVVVVPPGEQPKHAAALAEGVGRAVVALEAISGREPAQVLVVPGLPRDPKSATAALARFNGMRNLLGATGHLVALVLTRRELAEMQRHAADVYSARLFIVEVPFAPDPDVDVEVARRALRYWQRERFGRLDLRGFVRSEGEDVAWRIEDIYQDIEASSVQALGDGTLRGGEFEQTVVDWLEEGHTFVLLGHPGSGKTFFLRWLALSVVGRESFGEVARPFPLLASLAAYAEAPGPLTLYDHLVETLLEAGQPAAHALAGQVAAGHAVFLLDGLDEVGDESARARVVVAVEALRERAPGCMIVATSRIAGYDASVLPHALHLMLSPFDDGAIRGFLLRWCEQYALDRAEDSPRAGLEGQEEGEQLARDVLAHKDVRELARNPLMLTVLAIVHRTGVRLPDHRVELYDHATRVLVERWNRVRSLTSQRPPPPLKTADAVRLLGPVALEMVRSNVHGVIAEDDLRRLLDRALSGGALRGLATVDEAISLFRNALGLLVEQGPGLFAFMHLTLAEYFAAWELARSDELERLVSREVDAFHAEWREVILLAAGVLGVIRADDERLESLVDGLMDSAARRRGRPSPGVPSLLGGLLADDPGLPRASIEKLVKFLIPAWWFERGYGASKSLLLVVREATSLVRDRIRSGRAEAVLQHEILRSYGDGPGERVRQNLLRGGEDVLYEFFRFLEAADVDNGPALYACMNRLHPRDNLSESHLIPVRAEVVHEGFLIDVPVSRWLDEKVRGGALSAALCGQFGLRSHRPFEFVLGECDLRKGVPTNVESAGYVRLQFLLRPHSSRIQGELPQARKIVRGSVWIEFR